jgi:hypothetical protein
MTIENKPEHDPISDNAIVDAYMRWALMAAEEVAGKSGSAIVLKQSGLEPAKRLTSWKWNAAPWARPLACGRLAKRRKSEA